MRIYLHPALQAYTGTSIRRPHYLPASPHRLTTTRRGPTHPPTAATRRRRTAGSGRLVHLFRHGRSGTGTGISTRCPSTTPVGLALGPDSPWEDEPSPGTLGQSADTFLTCHSLLMPAFSLATPPPDGSHPGFYGDTTLPYPPATR